MPTGANYVCTWLKISPVAFSHFEHKIPCPCPLSSHVEPSLNEERFMRLNLQANICRMSYDLSTTEKIFRICCERKVMDSRPSFSPENMKSCKM
jgi:hypothetical protein